MNNDRFKFRVWDKDTHTYNTRNAVALSKSGELLAESVIGFIHYPDSYVVEQCTGMKDRKGRLIYEGDIVNAKWGPNIIKNAVVKHKRSGAFILEDGGRPMITVDEVHDIEIIGNIHEANVAHGTNGEREDKHE